MFPVKLEQLPETFLTISHPQGRVHMKKQSENKNNKVSNVIGVDVSKASIDVYRMPDNQTQQFSNDPRGCDIRRGFFPLERQKPWKSFAGVPRKYLAFSVW